MSVRISSKPVLQISTAHAVEIEWWWKQSHLHNSEYTCSVQEKVDARVSAICQQFGVVTDGDYRCQWAGERLCGDDLAAVTKAGQALASFLARFKFIDFIEWH